METVGVLASRQLRAVYVVPVGLVDGNDIGQFEYASFNALQLVARAGDVALLSGTDEALDAFTDRAAKGRTKESLVGSLKRLFGRDRK